VGDRTEGGVQGVDQGAELLGAKGVHQGVLGHRRGQGGAEEVVQFGGLVLHLAGEHDGGRGQERDLEGRRRAAPGALVEERGARLAEEPGSLFLTPARSLAGRACRTGPDGTLATEIVVGGEAHGAMDVEPAFRCREAALAALEVCVRLIVRRRGRSRKERAAGEGELRAAVDRRGLGDLVAAAVSALVRPPAFLVLRWTVTTHRSRSWRRAGGRGRALLRRRRPP
jgi:hypothetical protein